ncbi:MAG TPA: DinB family protein, partial [Candidatus Limnocylindria bacterium]|nr:DinB family protein [Candidatus Limnocylindria bacterium]
MSIRLYFDQWPTYNERIVEIARDMTDEQLAIRPAPSRWPIWATIAHTAGTRVYWLCGFLGEPGAESTPLPEAVTGLSWEDEEDHPRSAGELVT